MEKVDSVTSLDRRGARGTVRWHMKVGHILRKYNPHEWGGTETAVYRLLNGLAQDGTQSFVYAPCADFATGRDPLAECGHVVRRYRAFLPVWGLSRDQRSRLIANGGNLMSFDLLRRLCREPGLEVVHTHALNRVGAIGLFAARRRRIPLVVTIHGGALDLPEKVKRDLAEPLSGGWEWGKLFGWILRSRRLLAEADAVLTCNQREAALLREKHPHQRIVVQPHGVPAGEFQADHRAAALDAFPQLLNRQVLLCAGRIDPIKNQGWLVSQMPRILERHPQALLVLAGPCTDAAYGKGLKKEIRKLGLSDRVLLVGGLPARDPRLLGLMQAAEAAVLPSHSETFGLVILEYWAAKTPVLSTRTSGASGLIEDGRNGFLFDVSDPAGFHTALDATLERTGLRRQMIEEGYRMCVTEFDSAVLAARVGRMYHELAEEKRRCAT